MSIAAEAGRLAVCLLLLIFAIAGATVLIQWLMRVPYRSTAYVGSAWAPIEFPAMSVVDEEHVAEPDPTAPVLDRYRELHSP